MDKPTILITGGANGLGKDLALYLVREGYNVIILDKLDYHLLNENLKSKIYKYIQLDLADINLVKDFIKNQVQTDKIKFNVLIINAFLRLFKDFRDFSMEEIVAFTNSSLQSQLLLANIALNKMLENNYGRIFIISSKSGLYGYSTGSLYCSLKSAWIILHESLTKELSAYKKNVNIITICPDSFSDIKGNKYAQYDFIVNKIKKIIISGIRNNLNDIYFPITLKNRLILISQMLKKLLKIF